MDVGIQIDFTRNMLYSDTTVREILLGHIFIDTALVPLLLMHALIGKVMSLSLLVLLTGLLDTLQM